MRASPALAERYAALKCALVAECDGDRGRYQQLKSSFIAEAESA